MTRRIEDAISGLGGIKTMTSTSQIGLSQITIEFKEGTDVDVAASDIQQQVSGIRRDLPAEVEEPELRQARLERRADRQPGGRPATGDADPDAAVPGGQRHRATTAGGDQRRRAGRGGRWAGARGPGRGAAGQAAGVRPDHRRRDDCRLVTVPERPLAARSRAAAATASRSATLRHRLARRRSWHTRGIAGRLADGFRSSSGTSPTCTWAARRPSTILRLNGQPAAGLLVYKQSDANITQTVDAVLPRIEQVNAEMPAGFQPRAGHRPEPLRPRDGRTRSRTS